MFPYDLASDSSDSENIIDGYEPKVEFPGIPPCKDSEEKGKSPEEKYEAENVVEKKKHGKKHKSKWNAQGKSGKMQKDKNVDNIRKDSDDEDSFTEISAYNDDFVHDILESSSESDKAPAVGGNWKAQGQSNVKEAPKAKRIDPRLKRKVKHVIKTEPTPPTVIIKPPDSIRPGGRPFKGKRKLMESIEKQKQENSEKELPISPPDSDDGPRVIIAPPRSPRKSHESRERSSSPPKSTESEEEKDSSDMTNKMVGYVKKMLDESKDKPLEPKPSPKDEYSYEEEESSSTKPHDKKTEKAPVMQKTISPVNESVVLKVKPFNVNMNEYICSLEDKGVIQKRTYVKLFQNNEPIYSVKMRSSLTDGNIDVSAGGSPHISGPHVGTIIVGNDMSDFSLRQVNYEGKELITIRTNMTKKSQCSGYALFIHGLQEIQLLELFGYRISENKLQFRSKYSNEVYATFTILSPTTLNIRCLSTLDSLRCFAAAFAILMKHRI